MRRKQKLGIVGGMGPLASAEFVRTIYEQSLGEREQDSPVVLMQSDPTFPDRTQALLAGEYKPLLNKLKAALDELSRLGASKIVICCITIHYLLPMLSPGLRRGVVSLLDVIFAVVAENRKRHLLITTLGARSLGIYERHPQWQSVKDRIIMPDEADQKIIHNEIIYQIKKNHDANEIAPALESLLWKYDADSFIAGCTEIHLLAKHFSSPGPESCFGCVDPLMAIAKDLAQGKFWGRTH